jgi:hypothetical protein
MTKITGTYHKDVFTFMTISRRILLRTRNVLDKSCTENQNTHFMFNNVDEYGRVRDATDNYII